MSLSLLPVVCSLLLWIIIRNKDNFFKRIASVRILLSLSDAVTIWAGTLCMLEAKFCGVGQLGAVFCLFHTFELDGESLPAMLLYSESGDSCMSRIHCS